MFGFGNKKRIEELERQVEVLAREIGSLQSTDGGEFSRLLTSEPAPPCKCESCGVKTTGTENKKVMGLSGDVIGTYHSPIYITTAKAIEKIMDHLGLEFDHIEATSPDTVIKPKETP